VLCCVRARRMRVQIVTYKWLARHFRIPANYAKQ
jgi:hypothetical protein